MKQGKIIIENRANIPIGQAMSLVLTVISSGRISNGHKQFCYATRFANDLIVVTDLNKNSDRFIVYKEQEKK